MRVRGYGLTIIQTTKAPSCLTPMGTISRQFAAPPPNRFVALFAGAHPIALSGHGIVSLPSGGS